MVCALDFHGMVISTSEYVSNFLILKIIVALKNHIEPLFLKFNAVFEYIPFPVNFVKIRKILGCYILYVQETATEFRILYDKLIIIILELLFVSIMLLVSR